jgi:hypothetical protein
MPSTTFTVHSTLSPSEVLDLLTDFGPDRAKNWPNNAESHFEVHGAGPTWAEVTEGNSMGWERERYTWDAAAGTVDIETLDSNLWGSGSGWHYVLTPAGDGTDVRVRLNRVGKSLPGKLIGALIPVVGAATLKRQLAGVLRRAERS